MKLYATVASERASKGQGGNDKLEIELTIMIGKEIKSLASITVLPSGTIVIDETEYSEIVVMKDTKGEQQKGEVREVSLPDGTKALLGKSAFK